MPIAQEKCNKQLFFLPRNKRLLHFPCVFLQSSVKPWLSVGPYDVPPKSGNEYIVVRVKIVNTESSEASYNELDFHAESGSGNVTDSTVVVPPESYTAKNLLNSGNLAAGGSVTG